MEQWCNSMTFAENYNRLVGCGEVRVAETLPPSSRGSVTSPAQALRSCCWFTTFGIKYPFNFWVYTTILEPVNAVTSKSWCVDVWCSVSIIVGSEGQTRFRMFLRVKPSCTFGSFDQLRSDVLKALFCGHWLTFNKLSGSMSSQTSGKSAVCPCFLID